jgi:hypothetical protein
MHKNEQRSVRIPIYAFAALRRPVGFSQDFVVSPYPNNSNAGPVTLKCSVVAMTR